MFIGFVIRDKAIPILFLCLQYIAIEVWEFVKLQELDVVVSCIVKEMIFLQDFQARFHDGHYASYVDCKRGIQGTFNALFLILMKSIYLSPPCFFLSNDSLLFYLCRFSIPNKVKN